MWKMGEWKKAISMFLAAAMLFSMDMPLTVSAAESEEIPVYEVSAAELEEIPVYEVSAAEPDESAVYEAGAAEPEESAVSEETVADAPALYDATTPTKIGATEIYYTYDSVSKTLTLTGTGELCAASEAAESPLKSLYDTYKFDKVVFDNCTLTGSMQYLFHKVPLTTVNCAGLKTSGVTSMKGLFQACTELTGLDVSSCDIGNVTDMSSMFYNCVNLRSITFGESFTTENVTKMDNMFSGCRSLSELDLKSFNTAKVTDMNNMFYSCASLGSLKMTGWDTGLVKNMSNMFAGCVGLLSLADVKNFNTANVENMSNMFNLCSRLTSLDLSGAQFNTAKVTTMESMFSQCGSLGTLNISMLKTDAVKNMRGMFNGCSSLTSLSLPFNTANVTNMGSLFSNCTNLQEITFGSEFTTKNVTDMSSMFYNCSYLTDLDLSNCGFDTAKVTTMESMFSGCTGLVTLDLSSFDAGNVANMNYFFTGCDSISKIITPKKMKKNVTAALPAMYTYKDAEGNKYTALSSENANKTLTSYEQGSTYKVIFNGNGADPGTSMADQDMGFGTRQRLKKNTYKKEGYIFIGWNTKADRSGKAYEDNALVIDLTEDDSITLYAMWELSSGTIGTINWSYDLIHKTLTLKGTGSLPETLAGGVNVSPFKDIYDKMDIKNIKFEDCKLSGSAAALFKDMATVTNIEFDGFRVYDEKTASYTEHEGLDASGVTNMSYMFAGCSGLTTLGLKGFISGNVTNIHGMFSGCTGLRYLTLKDSDTSAVTDMGSLFEGCSLLEGDSIEGKELAFELDLNSFDTQKVTDMSRMFYGCSQLGNLKLDTAKKFKTAAVKNMSEMFAKCGKLKQLDVTFNTAAVTNMKGMFDTCESLEQLNVSSFNTEKVTDFSRMFADCRFTSLNITNFTIGKNAVATDMLSGFQPSAIHVPKKLEIKIALPTPYWDEDGLSYNELSSANAGKILRVDENLIYYTVTFDGNGNDAGTMEAMFFKLTEKKELTANAFSKVGYSFTGWNTRADGAGTTYADKQSVVGLSGAVGDEVILYAQWIENQYTIKFDGNNSTEGAMEDLTKCVYGKKYNLTENVYTRRAYTFGGWNSKADGTGDPYADKAEVESLTAEKDGVVTLYAQWIPIKYSITYNMDGGVNHPSNPSSYDILTDTIVLGTPTKPDHYFVGWYLDFAFTERVTEIPKGSIGNTTFFARWKRIVYRITYCMNGGVNHPENLLFYDENDKITFLDPTRPGYTFGGWYSDITLKKKIKEIDVGSAGDRIVYAKWTPNKYTVNFDGNGADKGSVKSMKKRTYGSRFTLSANKFKKSGYSFAGWNTKADGSGTHYRNKEDVENLTDEKDGTVTLYAQWRLGGYAITYNLRGGDNDDANPDNYDESTGTIVLKDPTRPGYTFVGWFTNSKCKSKHKITQIDAGSSGDKNLYAKWKANKYTIVFDNNVSDNDVISPAQGSMKNMKNRVYGKKYKLSANKLKRHGYVFAGWNTRADGTGIAYKNKASVKNLAAEPDGEVVLYAQWLLSQYKINYKNVYYYDDDVSDGNPLTYNVKTATITLNDAIKSGFTFEGWYTDAKFKEKNKVTEIPIGSKGVKNLYAKFTAHKYTIKFDANGGSGDMDPMEDCKCGWLYPLKANKFKAEGYVFAGWNLRADGRGRKIRDRESVSNLTPEDGATVTLYAQWKEK